MKQNSENTEDLDRDQAEENDYMNGNAAGVQQVGQSTQLNVPSGSQANVGQPTVEAPDAVPQ